MPDILHRVGIAAQPDRVFAALTTIEGIRDWWIANATGEAGCGGTFRFRANNLHVTEAGPDRVRWHYSGPAAEWVGTEIRFRPVWRDEQTYVLFEHAGWREPSEFMHHCSTKWAVFLLSLKRLIEQGQGNPEPNDTKITIDG